MSWKIAIVVALLTALITAVVTGFVGSYVAEKLKVSNFEGGRGWLVLFLILIALVGGLIIGFIGTRIAGATEWNQFWKATGLSLAISNGIVLAIGAFFLLSIPRQLTLDGQPVALQFEIFLPKDLGPAEPNAKNLYISLYANDDDNNFVELDTTLIHNEGDAIVIPSEAMLNTVSSGRMLSLTVNDTMGYTLDMPLQPTPHEEDMTWTDKMPMRLSVVTNTQYTYTRVMVRYRVVKKDKVPEA